jgi:hypothetical protein
VDTKSWYDMFCYKVNDNNLKNSKIVSNNINKKEKYVYNCIKIQLCLNNEQKNIVDLWIDAYTKMYNKALRYIKNKYQYLKQSIYTYP